MELSIFALEVCLVLDDSPVHDNLRNLIHEISEHVSVADKWQFYQSLSRELRTNIDSLRRGCWDYFDDDQRARKDYEEWTNTLTQHVGVKREMGAAEPDPYRVASKNYFFTVTAAFLLVKDSECDTAIRNLLEVPAGDLWKRATFIRALEALATLDFASVKSDTVYLIPRDSDHALRHEDLERAELNYLRTVT